ncbi:MAG: Transcription elongation factor GreA [Berkelbacteria bacterium GW2011_GWA1_36_9]|uniref:Transcription elongation factor GreA n=1 Tax=Berkelbacteria bacterium GW2011_GWA1_36_9 TaxID=1618331 RepID=A0A0G0FG08_9BACT|nr:MAG: Transcription elongation factor GreA [Berkelbacteria bacterium GW2011_GWA1_36_9]
MQEQILLTVSGHEKIKKELQDLKNRRLKISQRIKTAREFGDLSENSEYEDAKNEQSFVEGRILELEEMLRRAKVLTKNGTDKVELGSTVILKIDGQSPEYTIVGASESDPGTGKISVDSPLGHSLMGCAKGEEVEILTPNGKMACEVVAIK